MTWNHHDPHNMDKRNERDTLPADLRDMDQRIARDGARWRAALPPTEGLTRRVAALLEATPMPPPANQPRPGHQTHAARGLARHDQHHEEGRTPMHLGRTRNWLAAAAALLVVGLMAALFLSLGLGRPGGHTTTRQVATVTKLTGHWESVIHLSKELTPPIIAPSDPRVAYEMMAPSDNGVAHGMRRTDDDGATWHALPTPTLPGPLMDATIRVSPVDAHNVFLQLDFGVQMTGDGVPTLNCPSSLARVVSPTSGAELLSPMSNYGGCPALFYSTDGGDHWAPAHLPIPSLLVYTNASWPMVGMNVLQAQGDRLYAAMQLVPNGTSPVGTRLMVSADHGATWQLADASLFTQAPAICDMAVAPQGATLFALTADSNCYDTSQTSRTVWRSDDDGAQWTQTGTLSAATQQVFAIGGNGAQPLLYITSLDHTGTPTLAGVRVSTNGGITWQTAPEAGVPANMALYQAAGVLPDGSLVAAMLPVEATPYTQPRATYTYVFYTWRAGESAWRQLSANSLSIGQPGSMVVAPGGGTTGASIWVVTINGEFLGGTGATFNTDEFIVG